MVLSVSGGDRHFHTLLQFTRIHGYFGFYSGINGIRKRERACECKSVCECCYGSVGMSEAEQREASERGQGKEN